MGWSPDAGAPTKAQANLTAASSFTFTNGFTIAAGDLLAFELSAMKGSTVAAGGSVADNINGAWRPIGAQTRGAGATFIETSLWWLPFGSAGAAIGAMTVTVTFAASGTTDNVYQLWGFSGGNVVLVCSDQNQQAGSTTASVVLPNTDPTNLAILAVGNSQNAPTYVASTNISVVGNQADTNLDAEVALGYNLALAGLGNQTLALTNAAAPNQLSIAAIFGNGQALAGYTGIGRTRVHPATVPTGFFSAFAPVLGPDAVAANPSAEIIHGFGSN